MSLYPSRHSDIDCETCGRWFTTTCELVAHEEDHHAAAVERARAERADRSKA